MPSGTVDDIRLFEQFFTSQRKLAVVMVGLDPEHASR